ncbi:MAG: hypothetical protein NT062_22015, partial [Proteobacteria bacterium]|nr:hypothetical protein [Pseudomonadota bacterium]
MRRALAVVALVACKSTPREAAPPDPPLAAPSPPVDAAALAADASPAWAALADMPHVDPVRVIHLPTQATVPRFDVAGPVIAGDLAIVASSQFGFVAVDWRTGALAWSKPAGARIAPPIVVGRTAFLLGECTAPATIPDGRDLLGCLRVVTFSGTEQAYLAVHGPSSVV